LTVLTRLENLDGCPKFGILRKKKEDNTKFTVLTNFENFDRFHLHCYLGDFQLKKGSKTAKFTVLTDFDDSGGFPQL
jgi:hypothetical protein